MQEIENNTEAVISEFDKLYEEAENLDVYIPTWVNKGFERLYKFAYLQVKKDKGCNGMSSTQRRKLIMGLMNMYYKKIVDNSFTVNTMEEKVEGKDVGTEHSV